MIVTGVIIMYHHPWHGSVWQHYLQI